jgi:23S rRNA pseudouridine2605 synthase
MEERLQKLLARAGLGSRRSSEELIVQGRVTVNGQRAELGQRADPERDHIAVDGQPLAAPERLTYVLLNKPRGVVSSLAPQGDRQTVRDLVPLDERLYPVGRLDVDSEGLVLLTNDGELADRLTHPRYEAEKEYRVLVKGTPDSERLEAWRRGVVVDGQRTAPALVTRLEKAPTGAWLRIIMHEGRKHEIRDIGLTLGLPVQRLIRVRLGSLTLGDLAPGDWRRLSGDEVRRLRAPSASPQPAPRPSRSPARRSKPAASARRAGRKPPASSPGRQGGARRPNPNKTKVTRKHGDHNA